MPVSPSPRRYAAFISYRHEPLSRKWAMWLHRTIESYRVPKSLVKQRGVPRRVGRVFRDEEELAASADLSSEIDTALAASDHLIVVCTPETPKSRWVNAEIERFRAMGRGDKILALLVEGDPRESFPPALLAMTENEPVASAPGSLPVNVKTASLANASLADARGSLIRTGVNEPVASAPGSSLPFNAKTASLANAPLADARGSLIQTGVNEPVASAPGSSIPPIADAPLSHGRGSYGATTAIEPLAADVRDLHSEGRGHVRTQAKLRLIATILGVSFDDLRNRELRRRQARVLASAVVAAALAASFGALSLFAFGQKTLADQRLVIANDQTAEANKQRDEAEKQRKEAETQRAGAEEKRKESEAVVDFINTDVFAGTTPERMPDKKVRDEIVAKMLEPAAKAAKERFIDRPLLEAAVTDQIGQIMVSVGRFADGEQLIKSALSQRRGILGENHPDTISSLYNYGAVLQALEQSAEAERVMEDVLERCRRLFGNNSPETISAISAFAVVLRSLGRAREAEPLYREALDRSREVFGDTNPYTTLAVRNYGAVLQSLGRFAEAEPLQKDAFERRRQSLGMNHPDTIQSVSSYAYFLFQTGRLNEAAPWYQEALTRRRRVLGNNHPDTLASLIYYVYFLEALGRSEEALSLSWLATIQSSQSTSFGPYNPNTKLFASRHARILDALSRHEEAAAVRREFDLPDPSTQPTTTQASGRPGTAATTSPAAATQPVLIGPLDDDIGRFAKKIVAEWDNDAAWAEPAAATLPALETAQVHSSTQPN